MKYALSVLLMALFSPFAINASIGLKEILKSSFEKNDDRFQQKKPNSASFLKSYEIRMGLEKEVRDSKNKKSKFLSTRIGLNTYSIIKNEQELLNSEFKLNGLNTKKMKHFIYLSVFKKIIKLKLNKRLLEDQIKLQDYYEKKNKTIMKIFLINNKKSLELHNINENLFSLEERILEIHNENKLIISFLEYISGLKLDVKNILGLSKWPTLKIMEEIAKDTVSLAKRPRLELERLGLEVRSARSQMKLEKSKEQNFLKYIELKIGEKENDLSYSVNLSFEIPFLRDKSSNIKNINKLIEVQYDYLVEKSKKDHDENIKYEKIVLLLTQLNELQSGKVIKFYKKIVKAGVENKINMDPLRLIEAKIKIKKNEILLNSLMERFLFLIMELKSYGLRSEQYLSLNLLPQLIKGGP